MVLVESVLTAMQEAMERPLIVEDTDENDSLSQCEARVSLVKGLEEIDSPHVRLHSKRSFLEFERKCAGRQRCRALLAIAISFLSFITPTVSQDGLCTVPLHDRSTKDVYRVGVLANTGFDAAYSDFNSTFSDYLTATAGARFDPPIRFEMKPLDYQLLFTDTEAGVVDFIYVNPSAFSCIESEYGAYSLASQVSRRIVAGREYELTRYGGVIIVRDDSNVKTIQDIRGKSVACASISGLGSGQMQFRLLQQAGLSYINDPKQIVFTSNQEKVVNGVLQGDFDVGFVRTDQIERTVDPSTGELVNASMFRIIEPQDDLNIDGTPFPFQSSTQLYPEWNIAALTHVPNTVALEVQYAMLALADHADVGFAISECYSNNGCEGSSNEDICKAACEEVVSRSRCDTTVPTSLIAKEAMTQGQYAGFRPKPVVHGDPEYAAGDPIYIEE